MNPRRVFFWVHFSAGFIAGIVVLLMSVTGFLLAYERQIVAWADREHWGAVQVGSTRLSPETLLANASQSKSASPTAILLHSDSTRPAEVSFGRDSVAFVDPYTGKLLGEGSRPARMFFRRVEDWHRWLGADPENRAIARTITGACNLAFFVLVLTGVFLWWPRTLSWMRFVTAVTFRRQATSRARDWNWHTVTGFWAAVPLFLIVLCGVVMSYPWANDLLFRAAGSPPPQRAAAAPNTAAAQGAINSRGSESSKQGAPNLAGLDRLWARAEQQEHNWQSITFRLPARSGAPAVFAIDRGNGGRPDLRSQLTLNWETGEVTRWQPFSSNNRGQRMRQWVRWTHTGEAGGWLGQMIGMLSCAAGSVLVITGLALAWRRVLGWQVRPSVRLANESTEIAQISSNLGE